MQSGLNRVNITEKGSVLHNSPLWVIEIHIASSFSSWCIISRFLSSSLWLIDWYKVKYLFYGKIQYSISGYSIWLPRNLCKSSLDQKRYSNEPQPYVKKETFVRSPMSFWGWAEVVLAWELWMGEVDTITFLDFLWLILWKLSRLFISSRFPTIFFGFIGENLYWLVIDCRFVIFHGIKYYFLRFKILQL